MNTNVTESLRVWRRRAMAAVGALMLAGNVVALTASTASAEMRCHYPPGSNTCLTIEPYLGHWFVKVGIDITNISLQESLDLIAAANAVGVSPFVARIRGYDGGSYGSSSNTILFTVPLTATAYWGVLTGEGYMVVPSSALNEDTDSRDELYAEVILQDCRDFHRIGCYYLQWFYSGFIFGYW